MPLTDAAGRIAVGHAVPGVFLGLLHAQRDFVLLLVDPQHDDFDLVVDLDQLAGMADAPGPGHLADVDQALDALFELHEGAVAHHVDHGAADLLAHGILLFDVFPGAGDLLLQAQGDLLLLVVDVQDLHFDFLVDGHHFRGVVDAAPAHVGDVQQAVDAAEVDEGAELGDVLDHALAAMADFQLGQQLGLLLRPLRLDQRAAADDDVPPRLVDLQHQALDGAADVVADVGRAADVDLAGRQEDVHADVHQQAALDLARDHAGDHVALVDRLHHLQPGLDLLGLALAQRDHAARVVHQAVDVLDVLDEDLDDRCRAWAAARPPPTRCGG